MLTLPPLATSREEVYASTMKVLPNRPTLSFGLVFGLAAILVVLAVLQYRWSGQVSEADRERLQSRLETSVSEFHRDYYRELLRLSLAFRLDPPPRTKSEWKRYVERYDAWEHSTLRPEMVSGVFLWEADEGASRFLRVDTAASRLEPVDVPPRLKALLSRLEAQSQEFERSPGRDVRLLAWTMDEKVPALCHPLLFFPRMGGPGRRPPRPAGYIIIDLNMAYFEDTLFPELARRHFHTAEGFIYRVEMVGRQGPVRTIYESDAESPRDASAPAAAELDLLRLPAEGFFRVPEPPPGGGLQQETAGRRPGFRGASMILPAGGEERWQLIVKHRSGSLDAVVAGMRRRNLAVSFGVLLLLAVSMAMIIIFTQRAQRLARLQMDFVAGVSHELRTPLAVICSAGDNLADGVVDQKPQIKQYGELIRNEGHRLAGMVEQVLVFSAGQTGRRYDLRPLEVAAVIDAVLADAGALIQNGGFSVEKSIDPDLPQVLADEVALKQCLQNLVNNAVKYGGDGRWLGVRARLAADSPRREIRIAVEDKGLGIDEGDLRHVFDPFYRGKAANAAQIHGTGLGLSLARDIAEAMGGKITVTSAIGRGSTFTLHLPAMEQSHEPSNTPGGG